MNTVKESPGFSRGRGFNIGIASYRALKAMELAKESGNDTRVFYPEPTDKNSVSIRHDNGWYIKER